MPLNRSPQPFHPQPLAPVSKRLLWLLPFALALVFVAMIVAWAEVNDDQARIAYEQTVKADALSVEAQLVGRLDAERVRLHGVAVSPTPIVSLTDDQFANLPDVIAGLDRLWDRIVCLDTDNQRVAKAERVAPIQISGTDELRIQSEGQAEHLEEVVKDANGAEVGTLIARYKVTDLLKSTDLGWLNRRYVVNFVSDLGQVIATSAGPTRNAEGRPFEMPVKAFRETTLQLIPIDAPASWTKNPITLVFLLGLLLLGAAASQLTRHEMKQVARAVLHSQTEAAWRQSMEDSALVGLRARDPDGRILYVNKTLCEMVGYERTELIGLKPPLPFWPSDAIDDMMARNLKTLAGDAPSTGFETRWRRRDGRLLDVMIFESRLVNSRGTHIGWMGSIIDISERKRLEEKDRHHTEAIAQHARLNDMGLLASELAHELNQPLTTIVSYSAGLSVALKKHDNLDADVLSAVTEVHKHARKAGDIVNWIRRQTSRSETVRKAYNIDQVVSEVVEMRRRHIQRAGAQLIVDLNAPTAITTLDRIGIEQVITNLIRNAADALSSQAGPKTIHVHSDVRQRSDQLGNEVQIVVSDNGPGLQGRTLDMLSSTFYSTKSEGMGLGLGICRSIIESHAGSFFADEAPGGGAQFRFTIPSVETALSNERL